MATSTVENYLKKLYLEERAAPNAMIPMGKLAAAMAVVPGTATAMVKALADSKLVDYSPREGVRLTAAGTQLALHVLRRHRLVELFLVKTLGLDWSEVHAEAEELEHVISEKVLARIDALLGHPTTDPHGDPIPTAAGDIPADAPDTFDTFVTCPLNEPVEITRVLDQEPRFLQFVDQCGLAPGGRATVRQRSAEADAVTLESRGREITLSTAAAGKFLVKFAEQS
jgi:DtxR family Mn-dependent transcriptional regulator